ncbi:hypothetical protein [Paenarthrobacter ureafaciens]|uniref:hypothetical protein n=1 Tax=Paenarthrobacter ureafaciens TaxID=37931 RepID=UPI0009AE2E82|nr:hypothetical protein [Paenarthrobacter ureafaciens]GLU58597.1 hypothetical protein Pure01_11100 [Paenarthrobacter ureafaciens]GLU61842.1 hypothetical protein Pure02_00920 [Paenarthrobacter ureafaciens]GLU66116.1 hypothetical protein Pure03_00920 [Paenarthrobacter ureafaciens]GLU71560.1 hypothetical protein Pure04_12750 [Paenarthrobacter ureafaciens]GLU74653.1 hypothetical protein Pure05_00930 [Paenarthrobacter ureafaciens]
MSTERDELADLIKSEAHVDWFSGTPEDLAKTIRAAGYRKPRTVTTVEELDTLPFKSVVMDDLGRVFHRWLLAGWQSAGPTLGTDIKFPAIVLHEGDSDV